MPNIPESWLREQTVNNTTANAQFDPDILQLTNGNILVSWTTSDAGGLGSPNGNEVFAQIFDPMGIKIGGEFRLNNASTTGDEQNSDLAALPGGGFVVVYHDLDNPSTGGGSNIRLEEYDANGVSVTENPGVVIDAANGADPNYSNPRVAVSSATSVLVVYEETTAGVSNVAGKIYNPTTDTYGAQFNILTGGTDNTVPDVAVLTNGNYVIAANRGGTDTAIEYRILDSAGGSVKAATFVTSTNTNTETDVDPSVSALTGGGFVIAYTNTDANDTDVEYRIFDAGGTQTASGFAGFNSGGVTNLNNEPVVAGLSDGSFVVVLDNDELNRIDVSHVSSAGAVLGSFNFAGAGSSPAVVDLADGRFAVTWLNTAGEISMEILDTRDSVNTTPAYTPDQWQIGTVGDDVFTANAVTEFVHGADGADTITESGLIKQYFGDAGADIINVVSSINTDLHDGGSGVDTIDWSAVSEVGATFDLQAGTATDTSLNVEQMLHFERLNGTNNADTIIGSTASNILNGNGGSDTISGGAGVDTIDGGTGNDTASYAAATGGVVAELWNSSASNDGQGASDTLLNIENLIGSAFNDTLVGDGSNNVFRGGAGSDGLFGGAGIDGADYSTATVGAAVDLAAQYALDGQGGVDFLVDIENVNGSAFNDYLNGNSANNVFRGGAGNDSMIGSTGSDTADYTNATTGVAVDLAAQYALDGQGGTDYLVDIENAIGSSFNDYLSGSSANNSFRGGAGNDTFVGGDGVDTADYSAATSAVTVELFNSATTVDGQGGADFLSGIENLTGSAFADSLSGDNNSNVFKGGAGNDSFFGSGGIDTADYSDATAGVSVELWNSQTSIDGQGGVDFLNSVENVTGSAFNDTLSGDNGNNMFRGGAGFDGIFGGGGVDTIDYSAVAAAVSVNLGAATTFNDGQGASDFLNSIENVIGTAFADTLIGDSNANFFAGGSGNDILGGGGNADGFVFAAGSGLDIVNDFSSAQLDKIILQSNLNGSGITTGAQALAHTFDAGGNAIVDLGGGNSVTLIGVTTASLVASDFAIV